MQDLNNVENKGFPTFNALGRAALVLGIPVVPLALVAGGSLAATMLLLTVLKGKALLLMLIPIPVVIFMKTVSRNDDQALKIIGYELRCWFYRRNAALFNGTTTLLATHFGRNLNDYQRFVEQHTEKTDLRRYVPAQDIPTYHR
ncbi:MAG TPA: type IV secretion system protein VirB3 [Advenella kashmirensis]|uniref:Type IV secretion system protein VirB3 n=1 Tax=Advenella kashmirensis TaxID=310575 RepID=A0A356LM64_9BURK|nr:type IV secretion system protein VirB3 [Advenella kashmirensis]